MFTPLRASLITAIVALLGVGGTIAFFYGRTNSGPAHVCGRSIVQSSPAAVALLGSPIEQRGATMGHESWMTGGLVHRPRHIENDTFWVSGPKGSATVRAFSERSPNDSKLTVMLVPDGGQPTAILYEGPIACAEWTRTNAP